MKYPAVKLNGTQARAVGRGIADYANANHIPVWECAILPDHVHLVVARTPGSIKQIIIQMKGAGTRQLIKENLHPFKGEAKCFARGEWTVFLDPPDVKRAMNYVANNPLKEGLPRQRWWFLSLPDI